MSNESRIPAGIPTGGQFAATQKSEGDVALSGATAEPVTVRVTLERWDANDDAVEVGDVEFDARAVFDTLDLKDLEVMCSGEYNGGLDHIFSRAVDAGLVDGHDGPFTVELPDEVLEEYITQRRAAGQDAPVATAVPYTVAKQRAALKAVLQESYLKVNTPWVISMSGPKTKTKLREAFREARETITGAFDTDASLVWENLDYGDKVVLDELRNIADGPDPRAGSAHDQAVYASAKLADWIIRRDASFAALGE